LQLNNYIPLLKEQLYSTAQRPRQILDSLYASAACYCNCFNFYFKLFSFRLFTLVYENISCTKCNNAPNATMAQCYLLGLTFPDFDLAPK